MPTFHEYMDRNGSIECNSKVYAFTSKASRTDRVFEGSIHSAEHNGSYFDEWWCPAIDFKGNIHNVYWLFVQINGSEIPTDELPWNDNEYVRIIFQ